MRCLTLENQTRSIIFVWLLLKACLPMVNGFSFHSHRRSIQNFKTVSLNSKLFGPEDDFDEELLGSIYSSSDKESSGDTLANDFYKELKKRGSLIDESGKVEKTSTSDDIVQESTSESSVPFNKTPPSGADNQSSGENVGTPVPKKKFTGQGSYYAQSPSSSTSGGRGRTPREVMMEREYQLVGRAEQGIAVQAGIAILALAFYIFIGLSGGIVSGRDAQMEDFGGDDEIPFEQLMPVQRDREVSVWL